MKLQAMILSLCFVHCSVQLNIPDGAQIRCGDNGICPGTTLCLRALNLCKVPGSTCTEQQDGALVGVADGNSCKRANGDFGICVSASCVAQGCGDGYKSPDEECDNGASNSDVTAGACRSDCRSARCGDAVVDPKEQCDDGPNNSDVLADACRLNCQSPKCGDAIVDASEECDAGSDNRNDNACLKNCISARCGDGFVQADVESCDTFGESGRCNADCTPAFCGDGKLNASAGETCDTTDETTLCNSNCTLASCGDGITNSARGEQCDTAGESPICNSNCTVASCGDGLTNSKAGEQCDSIVASAQCNANCRTSRCGDGFVNAAANEDCDTVVQTASCDLSCVAGVCAAQSCTLRICGDGYINLLAGETCDASGETIGCDGDCTAVACGDGYTNRAAGESCDLGGVSLSDSCDDEGAAPTCQVLGCGNGVQSVDEACDDNNSNVTDACPSGPNGTCQLAFCGDGFLRVGSEDCDDFDSVSGDGCTDGCTVESGFVCINDVDNVSPAIPSQCAPVCGDGLVRGTEPCDQGTGSTALPVPANTAACDANCTAAVCGDGFFNPAAGEECDTTAGASSSCLPTCELQCSLGLANADGNPANGCELNVGAQSWVTQSGDAETVDAILSLPDGSTVVAGRFNGTVTFGALSQTNSPGMMGASRREIYLLKLNAAGTPTMLTRVGSSSPAGNTYAEAHSLVRRSDGAIVLIMSIIDYSSSSPEVSAGKSCVAGSNAGLACTSHQQCPGGSCGLRLKVASFGQSTLFSAAFDSGLVPLAASAKRLGWSSYGGMGIRASSAAYDSTGALVLGLDLCEGANPTCSLVIGDAVCVGGGNAGAMCSDNVQCPSSTCSGAFRAVTSPASSGARDGGVAKYASTGNYLWSTLFTSPLADTVTSIAIAADDTIYASGDFCAKQNPSLGGGCSPGSCQGLARCLAGANVGMACDNDGECPSSTCGGALQADYCGDVFVGKLASANGRMLATQRAGTNNNVINDVSLGVAARKDGSIWLVASVDSATNLWRFSDSSFVVDPKGSGGSGVVAAAVLDSNLIPTFITQSAGSPTALAAQKGNGLVILPRFTSPESPARFGSRCVGGGNDGVSCKNPSCLACSEGLFCSDALNEGSCALDGACVGGSCGAALSIGTGSTIASARLGATARFGSSKVHAEGAGVVSLSVVSPLSDGRIVFAGSYNAAANISGFGTSFDAGVFIARDVP